MCVCMRACACMCTCVCICMCACVLYVCILMCVYACVRACMCACRDQRSTTGMFLWCSPSQFLRQAPSLNQKLTESSRTVLSQPPPLQVCASLPAFTWSLRYEHRHRCWHSRMQLFEKIWPHRPLCLSAWPTGSNTIRKRVLAGASVSLWGWAWRPSS